MKVYWNSLDARGQFVVAMKKFNLTSGVAQDQLLKMESLCLTLFLNIVVFVWF